MPSNLSREEKLVFWRNHVTGWKASILSKETYCREQNISSHTLNYWLKKLRQPSDFVPINIYRGSSIQLNLPNGIQIQLPTDFCEKSLKRLLSVII